MRRTYVYISLLISLVLLIGLNLDKFYTPPENDPEVYIDYFVNLSDNMLTYNEAWDEVQANGSIPVNEIYWINARLIDDYKNLTQWDIWIFMKNKGTTNKLVMYTYTLNAFTGDILRNSKGSCNYTPAVSADIPQAPLKGIITVVLIMVILVIVYQILFMKET